MTRARAFLTHLALALAVGYVLVFFSERYFWAVWQPGDTLAEVTITWLAYSGFSYLLLALVVWMRAAGLAALVIAGGVYGWLVEGTLAQTLYGTEGSAPFPLSLTATGLQWHMLISVVVGLWMLPRLLTSGPRRRLLALTAALGIGWGAWAPFQWDEQPPLVVSPPAFFAYAVVTWALLMLAYWLLFRLDGASLKPSRAAVLLLSAAVLYIFVAAAVIPLGWLPLVLLPSLLALSIALLWIDRTRTNEPPVLSELAGSAPTANWLLLACVPVWAGATYTLVYLFAQGWWPGPAVIFFGLAAAGALIWVWAAYVILRRRRTSQAAPASMPLPRPRESA